MQYIYDKKIQEKRREQQIKFKDIDKDDWVETIIFYLLIFKIIINKMRSGLWKYKTNLVFFIYQILTATDKTGLPRW